MKAEAEAEFDNTGTSVIDGLGNKIRKALADNPSRSWDEALHGIVDEHVNDKDEA